MPDYLSGIHPLGDRDGEVSFPRECKWEICPSMVLNGDGDGEHSPSPFPAGTR